MGPPAGSLDGGGSSPVTALTAGAGTTEGGKSVDCVKEGN
jgi:hypothetical protein